MQVGLLVRDGVRAQCPCAGSSHEAPGETGGQVEDHPVFEVSRDICVSLKFVSSEIVFFLYWKSPKRTLTNSSKVLVTQVRHRFDGRIIS